MENCLYVPYKHGTMYFAAVRVWHPLQVRPTKHLKSPIVSNDTNMHPQQVLAGCAQHTPPAKSTCSPPAKSPNHQLLIWWISTHAKTIISRGNPTHTHASISTIQTWFILGVQGIRAHNWLCRFIS